MYTFGVHIFIVDIANSSAALTSPWSCDQFFVKSYRVFVISWGVVTSFDIWFMRFCSCSELYVISSFLNSFCRVLYINSSGMLFVNSMSVQYFRKSLGSLFDMHIIVERFLLLLFRMSIKA